MTKGKCQVPGCAEVWLRTPRLCNFHSIAWFNSSEETETRHKPFDQVGPYQRWLKRTAGAPKIGRTHSH